MKNEFIDVALDEVGYKEGKNNDNKYGKYFGKNNVAWCALFVSWCAREAKIPEDIIPTYSGCGTGYNFFKKKGKIFKEPKVGDIVFYKPTKAGATSSHTGIVYQLVGDNVITIEGNTGEPDGVYKITRKKNYIKFLGFGRPDYGEEESTSGTLKNDSVLEWQKVMNETYNCKLAEDGSYGPDSQSKASKYQLYYKKPTIKNNYVKWLQGRLKELGYTIDADSSFGPKTEAVIKQFQKDKSLKVDGYVGKDTIKELLKG